MSVAIRLKIVGKKHKRSYRIVAATKRSRRQGQPLEVLGYYNPILKPPLIKIDKKRVEYWLSKGAILSDGVRKLQVK